MPSFGPGEEFLALTWIMAQENFWERGARWTKTLVGMIDEEELRKLMREPQALIIDSGTFSPDTLAGITQSLFAKNHGRSSADL
jgi:hypothetical protein